MLLERIGIKLFDLCVLGYMLVRVPLALRFAYLEWRGRGAEAEVHVDRLVVAWPAWILRSRRCTLEVEGREHIPADRAFLIYSNHQSKFDIPVLIAAFGRRIGFVAKRELFWVPGLAYWMRKINAVSLDRTDVSAGVQTLHALAQRLEAEGQPFVMFPEGTRTRDPERRVQAFKRGAIRLAAGEGLPVLPVSLDGTRLLEDAAAMRATRRGGRVIRVRIEPPRQVADASAPGRKAFTDALHDTIRSNWEAIRVEWPRT